MKNKKTTCVADFYFHSGWRYVVDPYWEMKLVGVVTNPNGDEWDIMIYCEGTGPSLFKQLYKWVFKGGRNPFKSGSTVEKIVKGEFLDPNKISVGPTGFAYCYQVSKTEFSGADGQLSIEVYETHGGTSYGMLISPANEKDISFEESSGTKWNGLYLAPKFGNK